jgi:hypothetical protein
LCGHSPRTRHAPICVDNEPTHDASDESKRPVQLPSMDELAALATNLEACMLADVERPSHQHNMIV